MHKPYTESAYNIYLVSDSSGETVNIVAKSAIAQFHEIPIKENLFLLVRDKRKMDKVIEKISEKPGPVLCTIFNNELQLYLQKKCESLGVPCIPILNDVINQLSCYFHRTTRSNLRLLNREYFSRIDTINYALAHDDGSGVSSLEKSDIILVGVSRTSKSPTSLYLAFRGYNVANVPFVTDAPIYKKLINLKKPLIIGLTLDIDRLINLRISRINSLESFSESYVDRNIANHELEESKRFFQEMKWPTIDITEKAIEETAAIITILYQKYRSS